MTKSTESLLQSQIVLVTAQAARLSLGLLATVVFVRTLDGVSFGVFIYLSTALVVASRIVDAGLNAAVSSEVSRGTGGRPGIFQATQRIRLWTGRVVALCSVAIIELQGVFQDLPTAAHLCLLLAVAVTIDTYRSRTTVALFAAHKRNRIPAVVSVVSQGMFVGCGVAVVCMEVPWALSAILLLLCVREALFGWMVCGWARRISLPEPPAGDGGGQLLRAMLPLGVATGFGAIYFYLDVFMIESMLGSAKVGIYGVAVRLLLPLVTVVSLAAIPLSPLLARADDQGRLKGLLPFAMASILGWALPCVAFLQVSEPIVGIITGDPGHEASGSLVLLALAGIPMVVGTVSSLALVVTRRWWTWCRCCVIGAFANVILNLMWIPGMGIEGAALATLATEGIVAVSALASVILGGKRDGVPASGGFFTVLLPAVLPTTLATGAYLLLDPVGPWRIVVASLLGFAAGAFFTFGPTGARIRAVLELDSGKET